MDPGAARRYLGKLRLQADKDSAALPPTAEEDQQHTEQAEAGQRQRGHGLHGGVVGRGFG